MPTNEQPVALVTGAGSGLGRAIAKTLASEGYHVVLTGRTKEKLEAVAREIGDNKTIVLPADVTNEDSIESLKKELLNQTDRLDLLVNNVGGVPATGAIAEMTLSQWREVLDKNLSSQFLVTREMLPALRKSKQGRIISVTSGMAHFFMPGFGAYSASKAAVEALMKTVQEEEKNDGIKVLLFDPINVISEGNPQGEKDPMEVMGKLKELLSSGTTA